GADVAYADWDAVDVLNDDITDVLDTVDLRIDEAEKQLVIPVQQPGRVDDVGAVDGVDDVGDRCFCPQHLGRIHGDVELGAVSALNQHARDAGQAVQPRLDLIRRQLPQIGLRHRIGREAVAG